MDDAEEKHLQALLKKVCGQLAEHFDSVQIVCTKRGDDDMTMTVAEGTGDYYARMGATWAWVTRQEEQQRDQGRERSL